MRLIVVSVLLAAGCAAWILFAGSRHEADLAAPAAELVLAKPPVRIVPANVAAAEFVCPLVGPERIAALPAQVDQGYTTFSARADGWERVARFDRYVAETLIAFEPDLVITHPWQSSETSELLRSRGIPVLVLPSASSWADIRAALERLGDLVGAEEACARIAADLDRRVAALEASAPRRAHLRLLVYSNTGAGGWTPGTKTTTDTMIRLAGMRNAAAEDGIEGHARIDFERFLRLDPDVIVVNELVAGEGSATLAVVRESPALSRLRAVVEDRIVGLPADLMASDSPRLVEAAELLAAEVEDVVLSRAGR